MPCIDLGGGAFDHDEASSTKIAIASTIAKTYDRLR